MFKERYISGDKFFSIPETDRFKHFHTDDAWNAYAFILRAKKDKDKPYTMLTHNSDWSVSMLLNEVGLDIKDLPQNIYWVAQNVDVKHPRIKSIPIGLENQEWHPEKLQIIESYYNNIKTAEYMCCAMFNPNTHPSRGPVLEHFSNKEWCVTKNTVNGQSMEEYFSILNDTIYCICPRGNGIDTHRIWEAWYMGCIPVVERCINIESYKKLPILICDSFMDVDNEYLVHHLSSNGIHQLISSDYRMLNFRYWEKKILRKVHRANI